MPNAMLPDSMARPIRTAYPHWKDRRFSVTRPRAASARESQSAPSLAFLRDISSVDTLCVLGEPLNPEAWHWAYEKFGKGRLYINNMWGQTELGGCPLCS